SSSQAAPVERPRENCSSKSAAGAGIRNLSILFTLPSKHSTRMFRGSEQTDAVESHERWCLASQIVYRLLLRRIQDAGELVIEICLLCPRLFMNSFQFDHRAAYSGWIGVGLSEH